MKQTEKKVRVTLDLSPQFYERLEALEQTLDASSKADVIRQALQLYEYVARRSMEGYTFLAEKDGQQERLVFFTPVTTSVASNNDDALVGSR